MYYIVISILFIIFKTEIIIALLRFIISLL